MKYYAVKMNGEEQRVTAPERSWLLNDCEFRGGRVQHNPDCYGRDVATLYDADGYAELCIEERADDWDD